MKNTKMYPAYPIPSPIYGDKGLHMSKLLQRIASDEVRHLIPEFIYFSHMLRGHEPCIRFYGGTEETSTTYISPIYTIAPDGAGEVVIQSWMNRWNCPNAFDKTVLGRLKAFINLVYPGLLLVWFQHLDESDFRYYLEGVYSWNRMLSNIRCWGDDQKQRILQCETWSELDMVCQMNRFY